MPADGTVLIDSAAMVSCLLEFLGDRAAGIPAETLPNVNFELLGMDSVDCLLAVMHLEERLGLTLDPALFLSNANLAGVLEKLSQDDGAHA